MNKGIDYHRLRDDLNESRALITCLDGALVDGRTAGGIGKRYLKRAWENKWYGDAWLGAKNFPLVKLIAYSKGEAAGLKYFMDVLAKTGRADKEAGAKFAREYIEKHKIPGAWEFLDYMKKRFDLYILCASIGCDLGVDAADEIFGFDGKINNPVRYSGEEIITGISIDVDEKNKYQKVTDHLDGVEIPMERCVTIGNDTLDWGLMKSSKLAAASPEANWKTKGLTMFMGDRGMIIDDYQRVVDGLDSV
jgi:phosphoserine phosphatase